MNYTANPWQYLPPNNQPGGLTTGGGGYVYYRNPLDAKRSGAFTPESMYPSGYLGNVRSRREDRVLNNVKLRVADRSYTRGVHRGEKADPRSYFWPPDFNPMTGLKLQLKGKKFAPTMKETERLVNDGKWRVATPEELGRLQEKYGAQASAPLSVRAVDAKDLLPSWR